MIQINPLKSYIDGGVRAALTTPPSASLVFDLPGKAIWVKGVKLKGTDHTYTFSHDNYITLTNTPDSNESEDIKIGVNTSALKNAIDTTYGVVSTTANGLAPKFTSGNKLAAAAATTYYFLGWAGSTLKWYQAPFRNIRINSEITDCLGVNNTDPLIISSGNGISVTWDSTNKKIIITNTKPDVNHNTDTKVALSVTTLNKNYAIILKGNDSDEGSITTVNFSTYLKFNPSTKQLTINGNKVITATDIYTGSNVGLVPTATSAQLKYFLRGDGTWVNIAAEVAINNTWRPIKIENTDALGSETDTGALSFAAGTGITLAWDTTNKRIIITNSSPDVNHNTDENIKQTPKTDNINRPLMMINGNTSVGEQINTSMFSTGIYANASTKMITANGFIKAGSSDNYILLGGGGHQTISSLSVNYANSAGNADTVDGYHASAFAAASHTHSYLPLSGAYITGTNIADMKVNIRNYFRGKPAGTNCYIGSPNINNFLNDSAGCSSTSVCGIMALNPGYDNYNHGHFLVSHYGDNRIGMIGLGYLNWYGPNWFAYTSDIPTRVSLLTNDSGFITSNHTHAWGNLICGSNGGDTYTYRALKAYGCSSTAYINFGYDPSTNNAGEIGFVYSGSGSGSNYMTLGFYGQTNRFTIYANNTISYVGNITASNFYSSSDIRLKNNINNISKSIRSFNWKESGLKSYGLIAQEIENEYPELVSSNDNGYKSINYTSALCMLVAKLENGLDKLKEKVKLLEDKLSKYENTL